MAWPVAGEIGMERSLLPLPKAVMRRFLRSTWLIFNSHSSVERMPVSTRSRMMARLRTAWGTEGAEARLAGRGEGGVLAQAAGEGGQLVSSDSLGKRDFVVEFAFHP